MRRFFKTLGPAVVGSAGVQLAMFADTIIASLLPTGAVSSLYYADRLYQLPVGVIGIAAGTVLLPEMSRRLAAGDVAGAHGAQNRALGFTLALAAPVRRRLPDPARSHHGGTVPARRLRRRGGGSAPAPVLAAYAVGLPAVVLIRSAVASFYARSDTTTPVVAALARGRRERRPEARSDGTARRRRPGARDRARRLGQSRPALRPRLPARLDGAERGTRRRRSRRSSRQASSWRSTRGWHSPRSQVRPPRSGLGAMRSRSRPWRSAARSFTAAPFSSGSSSSAFAWQGPSPFCRQ